MLCRPPLVALRQTVAQEDTVCMQANVSPCNLNMTDSHKYHIGSTKSAQNIRSLEHMGWRFDFWGKGLTYQIFP